VAGAKLLGEGGRLLVLVGGMVSMFGFLSGDMLASPRSLFAFGRDALLPRVLASVHPRFHTPFLAIGLHAVLIAGLATTSTFTYLALLSNTGVLTLYFLGAAAALRFVWRPTAASGSGMRIPGERWIPVAAMAVTLWILSNATPRELIALAATLGAGTMLYLLRRSRK
jgi:amino acid transporter